MLKSIHKASGYHSVIHYTTDRDEAVREFEEFMVKYCRSHALDFGTVDKYDLARRLGFYREYANAIRGHDMTEFKKGY